MGRLGRFFKEAFSVERLIGLGFLAVLVAVLMSNPDIIQLLRLKTFDYFQVLKPRTVTPAAEQPVKIIDIDEKSLQAIGQWPWSRSTIATMVKNLQDIGATIVAFDIVFAEPDRTNPSDIAKTVPGLDEETKTKLMKLPSNDEIFAEIIKRPCPAYGKTRKDARCVIMGQTHHDEATEDKNAQAIHKSIVTRAPRGMQNPDIKRFVPKVDHLTRNIPLLEQASVGQGFFSLDAELDGIVRRIPVLYTYKDELFTALSVEMLRVLFGLRSIAGFITPLGMEKLAVSPKFVMPTDARGRVWPYFSKHDQAKYISAVDVINMRSLPKEEQVKLIKNVRGRMMIVGTSAVGLKDIRATPIDNRIPGVEVHAQVIEAAARGLYLSRPGYMHGGEVTILFIVGILMIWLVPKVGAKWTLLLFAVMAGGSVGGSWYLFTEHRVLFDPLYGTVSVFLLYSLLTYTGYAKEEAQRQQTRAAFSKYLSPDMVAKVAADPDSLKLGGEQRELTLLFSDVRGFTTISEQFTPEGLTDLINKLLTPLTNVILSNQGTVDKYMGDAV
ncbi:MAG: adenylate/guanylate cyclase domain-containing protein, partial [Rhodospirillales bacterium]